VTRIYLAGYVGRGTLIDRTIRAVSQSRFSHTELVRASRMPKVGEQHDCISSSLRDDGVREKRIAFDPGKWEFHEVPWAPPGAWERAGERLGLPYDLPGIMFSHVARFARHRETAWFCSEICADAIGLGDAFRYSPGTLMRAVAERNAQWWDLPPPEGRF
jgi:hypothetical protein